MAAILPPVAAPRRKASYQDVLDAPEHQVAEILDGELFLSPRPGTRHALASSVLGTLIGGAFHGAASTTGDPGGWWILFEPELHLGSDVVVPDLAGWRRARVARLPDAPSIDLPPDWVCETLSPSTATIDRGAKREAYAREGVAHLWLLDPAARTLEVLELGRGGGRALDRWAVQAVYTGNAAVRAAPFADIELDLSRLWLD